MKRKMIYAAISYMLGLFFASFFTGSSSLGVFLGIILLFVGLCILRNVKTADIIFIAAFFLIAVFAYNIHYKYEYQTAVSYDGKDASFCGEITDIDYYDGEKAQYKIKGQIDGGIEAEIILYWDSHNCNIGDELSFECTLEKIKSDYLFDSESYYKSDNIFLTAENAENITLVKKEKQSVKRVLYAYREKIISDFKLKMGRDEGGFLSGIVFGEKTSLDNDSKTALYRCGIGHIMAVSGLHVAALATFLMFLMKKVGANKYISFGVLIIFLMIMTIIVKSPISIIRSAIMLLLIYSAKLFRRQTDTFNSLSIAVLLICISNPFVIESSAFWLSVSGTFGIGVLAPQILKSIENEKWYSKFLRKLIYPLCAGIVVLIPSLLYFDEISLISPITNLIIVPLCIAAMMLGFLYVISGGIISLLIPAKYIIKLVLAMSDFFSSIKYGYFSSGSNFLFIIALFLCGATAVFYYFSKSRRYLSLSIAISVGLFAVSSVFDRSARKRDLKIAVLGKNSNAAVVISCGENADIIDFSGYYKSVQYVRKYLMQYGEVQINSLGFCRKVNSSAVSYNEALNFLNIQTYLVPENIQNTWSQNMDIYNQTYNQNGFDIKYDDYEIHFDNNTAIVKSDEVCILIAEAGYEADSYFDVGIFYGTIDENEQIGCKCGEILFLDDKDNDEGIGRYGINNFIVEVEQQSGDVKIRRL